MGASFRLYVLVVLLSAIAGSSACGHADSATLTSPAATPDVSVKIEPNAIVPAFDQPGGCTTHLPFDLRFLLRLGGPADVSFNQVRFTFEDRSGHIDIPRISLSTGLSAGAVIPNTGPIPIPSGSSLPTSTSIPIPNATTLSGMVTSFGSARELPLSLRFDCGVASSGTLIVTVAFNHHGRSSSTETRVPVR